MKADFDPQMLVASALGGKTAADAQGKDQAGLKKACQDFEAIFLRTLFKGMRATVPQEGFLHGGQGQEIFQELQDFEVARTMAQRQSIGLAEAMFKQLQPLLKDEE